MLFLSTLSLRRATTVPSGRHIIDTNFYPRSPCGERPDTLTDDVSTGGISIHALLAESDQTETLKVSALCNFYPRSPCGERHRYGRPIDVQLVFLSTLSLRRATAVQNTKIDELNDFYPRSPCGERQQAKAFKVSPLCISIHALLAESDVLQS